MFQGSLASCIEHGLAHEVLSGAEVNRRFPGYRMPGSYQALLQPRGGFLLPERCIVAFVEAALARGATIHAREPVLGFEPTSQGGVRVRTDRAEYEADSLVFTAGAWNGKLLPFLAGLALPERQVLAWLQPSEPRLFTPARFPVFNLQVEEGRFYGFPVHSVPGFKFGKYHHLEEHGDADALSREPTRADEAVLRDFAERYFPTGAGPTMGLKACLFTNSPDEHFIIDLHPELPQVSFAAGFSGHGYKFASVMGEIMADLAQQRATSHNIDLFRLDRFGHP